MTTNQPRFLLALLACALLGHTAAAQVSTQKSLNLEGAQEVITAAEAEARRSGGTASLPSSTPEET